MLSKLKDFFNFNATERNGILVLILLIMVVAFIPRLYRFYSKPIDNDFTVFQKDIENFEASLVADSIIRVNHKTMTYNKIDSKQELQKISFFQFNPNHTPADKWRQLGLKDWQIRIIDNYLAKGGKFKKAEDLKNIYGITPAQYKSLEPYIILPVSNDKPFVDRANLPQMHRKTFIVDINTADTSTLQELRGIGPAFARRIIKYREMLGGFYSVEQLLEVYGFDQQKYDQVVANCRIGDGPFRKLNLNTVTTAELKKHPYMDYYTAKAIVDHRIAKGKFTSVEQLKEISLINDELYQKIKPYILLE
jgi:competence protein ComEA